MTNQSSLSEFIDYTKLLKGDEKGEAQLFCDRFFRAFGHGGIIEANGSLEARIKFISSGKTKFADCLWSPPGRDGVLIEMKKKSVKDLEFHFPQARDYWIEMNPEIVIGPGAQKPKYIILCNFERFLIYRQLSLVDDISINDLIDRTSAFNFMLLDQKDPIFHNNIEHISQEAARTIGEIFKHLIFEKNVERTTAQRFLLQCVLSLFSEDFGLLPHGIFTELINDCRNDQSSYDLIGGLFKQMSSSERASGGRYKDVRYFNGGIFDIVEPIELDSKSLNLLRDASYFNWKSVNPSIFGALFESTMNEEERHKYGAHFTSEEDILKIVNPTIIRPWKELINNANTLQELSDLLDKIGEFKVLDPACGCGNFLYIAYRALKDIEMLIVEKIVDNYSERSTKGVKFGISRVSTKQFFGLDTLPIAVEVAKVTMMLAKELAASDWNKRISSKMSMLGLSFDEGLPLDRLEDQILCQDALFTDWPQFDVVIGNPPFQSKNKMPEELGEDYIARLRRNFPEIPGRADYCVYWLRKAHDELLPGQRAGFVGTNTIRQNYSREGGLDYIQNNGGTITEAVSTQVWSGDAVVYVSIVNWIKGEYPGMKRLSFQVGDSIDSPFDYYDVENINSALSLAIDLSSTKSLQKNKKSSSCYQGQTHGHAGFLIDRTKAEEIISNDTKYKDVLFPYLNAAELIGNQDSLPTRYVIDFRKHDIFSASQYEIVYQNIKDSVYPTVKENSNKERDKTGKETGPRQNHFNKWWKFWRPRDEMMNILENLPRYIACGQVTKRPIFEFVSSHIHPNAALMVFPLADDYSFGILQSIVHWEWFIARCSTLKGDPRYTITTVFDSFPWPQDPTEIQIKRIAKCACYLRTIRRDIMTENRQSLRDIYRIMEETPSNLISEAQEELDKYVFDAYGMSRNEDILAFLLNLNLDLYEKEIKGEIIIGPGLPMIIDNPSSLITSDCVTMPKS